MSNQKMKYQRIDIEFEKGKKSMAKIISFGPKPLSPPVGCLSHNFIGTSVQDFYVRVDEDDAGKLFIEVNLVEGAAKSERVCVSVLYPTEDSSE